jgi:alkanesulfonate monooxygenase SsuD/methylene tetrahydromethanopterin reductase-like flavin-dependent oxidoreductase (luciferase family)
LTGEKLSASARHRQIIDYGVLGEQLGYEMVAVGEHHLCDYIVASPPVLLAAIAERTTRIRLGTGTTLLPTLDPIRVAEDYATLDVVSDGRVEVVVGRGVVARTYPDLGFEYGDSRGLYEQHLGVLLDAWGGEGVDLSGFRPTLNGVTVQPRPAQHPHPPVWIGGGFSPESVDLAAEQGLGLMLPTVLAPPVAFAPLVARYRERFLDRGRGDARVGVVSHVHVDLDAARAVQRFAPHQKAYFDWVSGPLMSWGMAPVGLTPPDMGPYDFDAAFTVGPVVCGNPAHVIDRISAFDAALDIDLYLVMMDHGNQPWTQVEDAMQLFAEEVAPALANS